jgi:translation initiation factor IF-1
MCDPDAFESRGVILSRIDDNRLWVEMSNGHRVVAVTVNKSNFDLSEVQTGDKVAVFFSPSDLARGTILKKMDIKNL